MILEATQSASAPSRSLAPDTMPGVATVIPFHAHCPNRIALREAVRIGAVFAVCLLGLISSFADSAVARSSFLLIDTPGDGDGTGLDSVAAALAWATIADIVVCIGIVLIGYCLLSRPSAEIVPLYPRRRNRKL